MNPTRRSILKTASALSALAIGASATASAADCSGVSEWDAGTAYSGGDQVTYDGDLFAAEWWTQGEEPAESENVWTLEGPCDGNGGGGGDDGGDGGDGGDDGDGDDGADCNGVAAYDASATYTGGDRVAHDDALWEAEWWTQGTEPAESETVWTHVGSCNEGPTAAFSISPSSPDPGDEVTFDAAESVDSDGSIDAYEWDLGDETTASGEVVTHAFDAEGVYAIELTVTDDADASATASAELTVGDPNQLPTATFTVDPAPVDPGQAATFDASGSSDPDGSIASYDWDFGDGSADSGDVVTHTYSGEGKYEVELTVADEEGDATTATETVAVGVDDGPTPLMAYTQSGSAPSEATHVLHAFGSVSSDGSISAPWSASGDDTDRKHLLALGGWGHGDGFPDAAADQSSRERFASDCVQIMRDSDLDGVDLDWEYPGPFGPDGLKSYPDDPQNFTALVEELSAQFDAAGAEDDTEYLLTAALSGHVEHLEVLEHDQLVDHLDYAMAMTYDYHSPVFVEETNHNSPLYSPADAPTDKSIDATLTYLRDQGWPAEKLALGMAFYGREFNQVQSAENDGLFQPFGSAGSAISYTNLPDPASSSYDRHWDEEAQVPWLFDGSSLITYDDEESVTDKAEYALERGHAVMYWDASHDPDGTLAGAVDEVLRGE